MDEGGRPHGAALLVIASTAIALASGAAGLLLGLPAWRAAALALVVPWVLAGVAGAVLLSRLLSRRLPERPRERARTPAGDVVVPREIDLRTPRRPRLPLPRQDRQPLDDVRNRPGGAP